MEDERRREVGLFRYALIREAADVALRPSERGMLVRQLSLRDHVGVDGRRVRVSRATLDRWIRAWQTGGFAALLPAPRPTGPRTDPGLLALAEQLKREAPGRTAAHIREVLDAHTGGAPSARTIQRHFVRVGLNRRGDAAVPRVFGRFQADQRNDLWTGDALHGPPVAGRKTYLFAVIDDYSRALTGYRWGLAEDTLRLEAALHNALAARGVPKVLYVDNGAAFASKQLARACAVLGVRLTHSPPGQPAGRGKIERIFATVRGQFLVEIAARGVADLAELNRLFTSWVERVYHRRAHRETGQPPLERFLGDGDPPAVPSPALLREAFLWSETRSVSKTATVALHGNRYEVDAALVGCVVELVFDSFDLTHVEARYAGRSMGVATPHVLGRRVHPHAVAGVEVGEVARTGIDYLGLIDAAHDQRDQRTINYHDLTRHNDPDNPDDPDDDDGGDPVGAVAP
ncbi:MAG: DDE-type integrase/transposase/recombinase [Euzebyaceae bacterium]|nr:DDE-type integrase/transposase/recombinase [Euzebyaceae bacterium]